MPKSQFGTRTSGNMLVVMKDNEMVYPREKSPYWNAPAMQGVKAQKPHADRTVPEQNTYGWRLV